MRKQAVTVALKVIDTADMIPVVQGDQYVDAIAFEITPRIWGETDLATGLVYVRYKLPDGTGDVVMLTDIDLTTEDTIIASWPLGAAITSQYGLVTFGLEIIADDLPWNSQRGQMRISPRITATGASYSPELLDQYLALFETARDAAQASAASAAATLVDFETRYLGPKAADPTVDNQGAALLAGALYYNTATGVMRLYSGTAWTDQLESVKGIGWTSSETIHGNAGAIAILQNRVAKRYTVKMTSAGTVTQLNDAIGKVYRRQVDTLGALSDFSSCYPWSGIENVEIDTDGVILSRIGDAGYGTNGGELVTKVPLFWSRAWKEGTDRYWEVSDAPYGDNKPIGFYNADGTVRPFVYIGSMPTSYVANTPHAWAGKALGVDRPLSGATGIQQTALDKSAVVDWSNIDLQRWEMLERLISVEIGYDSQSRSGINVKGSIGQGINGQTGAYSASNVCTVATVGAHTFILANTRAAYFKVGMTVQIGTSYTTNAIAADRFITDVSVYDASNTIITVDGEIFTTTLTSTIAAWGQAIPLAQIVALKNESGYVLQYGAENLSHVCYRGIWDLWGNIYQWMSGILRSEGTFWICEDVTKMNVTAPTTGAGWVDTGHTPDLANGYLKDQVIANGTLGNYGLPSEVGAGSTTWYAAYMYYFGGDYMSGVRVVLFGGYWGYGTLVSLFYWNGDDTPAYTSLSIGGRLIL